MSDRFPIFDVILEQRRRWWVWSVRTTGGTLVMTGSRSSRSAARYEADPGALFDAAERALSFAALGANDPC